MKCIVGISGGDLNTTDKLNEYAIEKTGKKYPNILFVPTASRDAGGYIDVIETYYRKKNCKVKVLYLCNNLDSEDIIKDKINWADLIYVGGGDTEYMINQWKQYKVDEMLIDGYEQGKVLTGISAGAICWFAYGYSDSDYCKNPEQWSYKFVKGLERYPLIICPHYNEDERNTFDDMLLELNTKLDGLALDNDTAIVIEEDIMSILKVEDDKKAYLFQYEDGTYKRKELQNGDSIIYNII